MTRFRRVARLIPACGLAFALMLPAAGSASPSANLGSFVQHDKGGGKGQGKDKQKHEKQRGKHQKKANKQKKNEHRHRADIQRHRGRDRLEAQQRFERQQRRERERQRQLQLQRQVERQRQLDRQRSFERDGRWNDDRWDDDWDDDDRDDRDRWEERERRDPLGRIFGGDRDRWDERSRGELVDLRGRIAGAGGCPTLRGDDGRTYELAGDLRGFGRGDSVRLVGVMEGGSRCGVGPSVRVGQIDRR